ncbi:sensor histidine kinase [Rhizobium tubonense]|uniref:histidine kinase n=1 Tax=Rhizobium tubonense TaxID=484088 RepID=A0A2W4CVN4_9HYPH|nr:sensor histidine kinase [Rhizobium tubonense]PZM16402.1 histidine kinase [Rhizobium tubonense]
MSRGSTLPSSSKLVFSTWGSQSLARKFLLLGSVVSIVVMGVVGAVVTSLIEDAVTRNSAAATALYVDSVIAPLLPDMQTTEVLDDTVTRALDETLGEGALGDRLISFRLWRGDGTILYSNNRDMTGRRFAVNYNLKTAFGGSMVAEFDKLDDPEDQEEKASGKPLLEIYNPVLQPWSGKVVAVAEFYEIADGFQHSLQKARTRSWLAVAGSTLIFFLALSIIVLRGSSTIESQRSALKQRVKDLSALLQQNEALRARVQHASQMATETNERFLRRLGADLHDGPAQLIALASLRIDSEALTSPGAYADKREKEIASIKSTLDDAMREIRDICRGLVLPQIETLSLSELLDRVVLSHQQRTGTTVSLTNLTHPPTLTQTAKICVYRFVQEALNNAFRHGGGVEQSVHAIARGPKLTIEVRDRGDGFDLQSLPTTSLGLAGLKERVESLGGEFEITTSPEGTTVRMSLNTSELETI